MKSIVRSNREQAIEQRLICGQGRLEFRPRRIRVQIDDAHCGRARIRPLARQHFMEDNAQAVEVSSNIDNLALPLFRAHVIRCAKNLAAVRYFLVEAHPFCKTEIDKRQAAVLTKQCEIAVVFRTLGSGTRYGRINESVQIQGPLQYGAPHGYLVPPQWFAMWARRHQHTYGSTSEDLGAIAVQEREHAIANPHAIAKTAMSIDDYMESRMVFAPFRVPDCCYEVDGSVALVLVSEERAKDLRHAPIRIVGQSDSFGFGGNVDAFDDLTCMYSRDAARRLWSIR